MTQRSPPDARSAQWQWRVTVAGAVLIGAFLLATSLWGALATWRVAMAFRTGSTAVQWHDGPDLVVMAAPLLVAAAAFVWPGSGTARPILSGIALLVSTVLVGTVLGKGDALLLDHVASANGYHYCPALDVWDPHGNRGGGPALSSWGYSRLACPASGPTTGAAPN